VRERGRGYATVWAGKRRAASFLVGVTAAGERELFEMLGPRQGSLSALAEPNAVALSALLAEQLHVKVGDIVTLYAVTTSGLRNAVDGHVVAITESVGLLGKSSGIIASNALMQNLYGYKPGVVGVLQATCAPGTDLSGTGEQLRQALKGAGFEVLPPVRQAFAERMTPLVRESWRGQRLDVSTWEDEAAFLAFVTEGLGALTFVMEAVVLAITVGGLFLSLSMAVRERTREIGTLRAMGMQRTSVVGVFLMEGFLTGLLASSLGATVAAVACRLLSQRVAVPGPLETLLLHPTLLLDVEPSRILQAVALISLGAALGAIVPATKAALMSPRAAMESLQ
jgi:putative ABC transport system permease protein